MNWIQVSIHANENSFDIISANLEKAGIFQVELIESTQCVESFLQANVKTWDYCDLPMEEHKNPCVRFFVPEDENGEKTFEHAKLIIKALKQQHIDIDFGSLEISTKTIAEEDWANNWKQYFKPFCVGENILVCPTWETPSKIEKTVLYIDPGMVFGTGLHQTTQLCLKALQNFDLNGKTVLDLGCGSGILSIAALLLGAKSAFALDIETSAPKVVLQNCDDNKIDHKKITAICGDILSDTLLQEKLAALPKFDFVVANIVADVLVALSPVVQSFLSKDGTCLFSGIIEERLEDVSAAIQQSNMQIVKITSQDDWFSIQSKLNSANR